MKIRGGHRFGFIRQIRNRRLDASWAFVKSQVVSTGAYEIVNLPNAGPFYIISEADAVGKNLISYKEVISLQ